MGSQGAAKWYCRNLTAAELSYKVMVLRAFLEFLESLTKLKVDCRTFRFDLSFSCANCGAAWGTSCLGSA